jgi:hypothetical protein
VGPRRQGSRRGRAPLTEIRPTAAYSEQVAEGWWEATSQALQQVVEAVGADRISGLCITHERESYAPVDTRNTSLVLWDDARAQAQLDELGGRFGHDELHRRTGRGHSLTQSLPKLLWLAQNEPDVAARALSSWTPTATCSPTSTDRCSPPSRPPQAAGGGARGARDRTGSGLVNGTVTVLAAGATGSALATPFRAAGWRVNLWGTGSTTTCSRRAPPAGPTRGPTSPSRPAPRCSTASGSASRSTGPTWPFSRSRRSACSRWRAGRSRASPARARCC